jgi:GNAT superfamily N-acetyltransferase
VQACSGLSDFLQPLRARAPLDSDADFLAHLYASTRTDLASCTADPALVASLIAMQQRLQGADYHQRFPDAVHLVLEQRGVRCGRLVLDARSDGIRLVDIALLPQARGDGLGRHILTALQRWAASRASPLTLAVHHANARARRLYLSLGFQSHSRNDVSEQMLWNSQPAGEPQSA